VRRAAIDLYLLPAGPQQQTLLLGPMLGQTDGRLTGVYIHLYSHKLQLQKQYIKKTKEKETHNVSNAY